ncbi:MAG: hypothetical protein Q8S26_01905 [Azonexus sp.]|nr:hypothetical protein [Azonexus sp.]
MANTNLNFRLKALEGAALMSPKEIFDSPEAKAKREKAMQSLEERLEEHRTGIKAWERLDPNGRIRYWNEKIAESDAVIALGADGVEYTPGVAPGICEAMHELTLRAEPMLRRSNSFGLLSAQLDRLAELNFDSTKIAAWRKILEPYRAKTSEWNPELLQLPADAMSALNKNNAK